MKVLLALLVLSTTLFFSSCEKDNVTDSNQNKRISLSELGNEDFNPDYKSYLNSFNWNDVTAYIGVHKTYINEIDDNNQIFQGYAYDSFARFYGEDLETPIEMGSISVNEFGLRNVDNFYYQLYESDYSNLDFNYGSGTNNINVTDNDGYTLIDTNINFFAPIILTNFSSYQNFSRAVDFNLTWSGAGIGSLAKLRLGIPSDTLYSDTTRNESGGQHVGINFPYLPNTGSINVEDAFDSFKNNGRKLLWFTKLEIKMLNMTNGKKLALFTYSTYQSSIIITN